jgi:carbamoyl-phosphate synthase/aspartate carbamoyltransferase/dihydroorotase
MLPLLLTAVHEGRLSLDDLLLRCVVNPRRIYGLPPQPETFVEVDVDEQYTLRNEEMLTRVGWTPFAGMTVFGQVLRVTLRGVQVFAEGRILAQPGSGRVLFQDRMHPASSESAAFPGSAGVSPAAGREDHP